MQIYDADYSKEKYEFWQTAKFISFERKLENETAFDNIVKVYSLTTIEPALNLLLTGNFFGDFIFLSYKGVFLRQFIDKTSWPNTKLIHIDLENFNLKEISATDSSFILWTVNDLGNCKYEINISPKEKIDYCVY